MQALSADPRYASDDDRAQCAEMIRHGSRTFHAASMLLPRTVCEPAYALYAFCRLSDDAVDLGKGKAAAVDRLNMRLDRIYEGRPVDQPADRALADTVERFALPKALPASLLEGLAWDAENLRYTEFSDLCAYAARVAGSVGAMMAVLMNAREPHMIARASDLGVAMQLTNIARDVGEDARMGRLYLPLRWLDEAGIDGNAFLAKPAFSEAMASVVTRLLAAADALYARAETGIACLPSGCRPAIFAARHIYGEIGREVERGGLDSISTRAVVSGSRKGRLMLRALSDSAFYRVRSDIAREMLTQAPLDETRFLVEAAQVTRPARQAAVARAAPPWWRYGERVGWVADLFHRLEEDQRQRIGRTP